jgi:predicted Holliday junction resolvase-like endonuclease
MWKHKFRKNQEIKDGKEKEKIIDEYIEIQNKIKTLKKRVAELGEQIQEIMKEEEAERLFSGDMIIARTSRKTWKFDEEKLKNILDEVGMWENVLKVDLAKLKKVSETLPPTLKRQVDDAKYIDGETWSLSIKKSK